MRALHPRICHPDVYQAGNVHIKHSRANNLQIVKDAFTCVWSVHVNVFLSVHEQRIHLTNLFQEKYWTSFWYCPWGRAYQIIITVNPKVNGFVSFRIAGPWAIETMSGMRRGGRIESRCLVLRQQTLCQCQQMICLFRLPKTVPQIDTLRKLPRECRPRALFDSGDAPWLAKMYSTDNHLEHHLENADLNLCNIFCSVGRGFRKRHL